MDEKSLREVLLAGAGSGQLPQIISTHFPTAQDGGDELARELAALHNEGQVDVVSVFEALNNNASNEPKSPLTSYQLERVFCKTLPHLNEPVASVMLCILGFRFATGLENAYIDFCKKDAARPREALKLIESDHGSLVTMLVATFVAGSQIDSPYYLTELLRFIRHSDLEVRRRAVLALTRFRWSIEKTSVPNSAITALEETVIKESDDLILANVIKSAFTLFEQDKTLEERGFRLIDSALAKGDEYTMCAASELLWTTTNLPQARLPLLLTHLKRVKPEDIHTIDSIDIGIAQLLAGNTPGAEQGLQFLEELLISHEGRIKIETFDSAAAEIRRNVTLISKIVTRWFLHGDWALCEAVRQIVGTHYGEGTDLSIEIDARELDTANPVHILFIARKAIGYLFIKPVTAASLVISLMRHAQDAGVLDELGKLLLDPLLMNYPGSVLDYLEERSKHESENVKEAIETSITAIRHYQEILSAIPSLSALHASQFHRETYRRHMSESMAVSMRAAEKKSVFSNLFTRSTLLYGNKSINYFYSGNGAPHRTEMPLTSHGISMELPRMSGIDPYGIDYILWVFRQEQFRT